MEDTPNNGFGATQQQQQQTNSNNDFGATQQQHQQTNSRTMEDTPNNTFGATQLHQQRNIQANEVNDPNDAPDIRNSPPTMNELRAQGMTFAEALW